MFFFIAIKIIFDIILKQSKYIKNNLKLKKKLKNLKI
jgi:hypothetical protein